MSIPEVWTCPDCGPLSRDPLFDGERMRCSEFECDRIVYALSKAERGADEPQGWKAKKKGRPKINLRSDSESSRVPYNAESAQRGRAILARVAARERGEKLKPKRPKPAPAPKRDEREPMPSWAEIEEEGRRMGKIKKRRQPARYGTCSACEKDDTFLLQMRPTPLCVSCFRDRNPEKTKAATEKAKRAKRAKKKRDAAKKKAQAKKPKAEPQVNEAQPEEKPPASATQPASPTLSPELAALAGIDVGLQGLNEAECGRILRWAVSKFCPSLVPDFVGGPKRLVDRSAGSDAE